MKINYLIDETANFWYFVANLSEWNNYVRPNLNNYIVDITGPLSELEKQTLNSFKSIFKEYGYNQKFWGKDLLSGVEKNISEDPKFNSLTEISELKSRFEKLWSAEKTKLELWKNSLSSQYTVSQGIINDCDILFGKSNSDQDINVLLLISAPGNVAGGADIGDQWVQLEVSGMSTQNIRHVTAVLWHELIHLVWQTVSFRNLVKDAVKIYGVKDVAGYSPEEVTVEAVTGSLLPFGLFRSKWLAEQNLSEIVDQKINDFESRNIKNTYYFGLLAAKNVSDLSKAYLDSGKQIDLEYLHQLIDTIL